MERNKWPNLYEIPKSKFSYIDEYKNINLHPLMIWLKIGYLARYEKFQ